MKPIFAAAFALPLALAGCGTTATDQGNAVLCMTTLLESGAFDPGAMAVLAASTPACQALAASVINDIIKQATGQNARLARAQGRLR
jgi:hypothetical protein